MADPTDTRDPVNRLLEGWGTPEAKPEFVDAVLARVDTVESAQRRRRRWGRALTFTVGGVAGGLVVAAVMSLAGAPTAPPSSARSLHLQAPGVAEVVGEPGSQLQWERREDGGYVLDVVEGVAWVRTPWRTTSYSCLPTAKRPRRRCVRPRRRDRTLLSLMRPSTGRLPHVDSRSGKPFGTPDQVS